MNTKNKQQLFIISGYSGAGKSVVLRALEDAGFYCVDNLPIVMLHDFFSVMKRSGLAPEKIALGIDVRTTDRIIDLIAEISVLRSSKEYEVKVCFLMAAESVIIKRFQETRRKHPLANGIDVVAAVMFEKQLLAPLIEIADFVLQTDEFSANKLRHLVRSTFARGDGSQLIVQLVSFGFKYGMPLDCNFVYDVRSLPNPYFVPNLRPLDGTSQSIKEYLFAQQDVRDYWGRLVEFVRYTVGKSYQESRFFIVIAIGCTGGRHRSVAFVDELSQQRIDNVIYLVKHRDVAREGKKEVRNERSVEKEMF